MKINIEELNNIEVVEEYFFKLIEDIFSNDDIKKIKKAYSVAIRAHNSQFRDDTQPYIIHPLRVAIIVVSIAEIHESDVVCSALLHDVVEDSTITNENIEEMFGEKIASYVKALTSERSPNETIKEKIKRKQATYKKAKKANYVIRAIKVADYLDNMVSWKNISIDHPARKKFLRWLNEAQTIYIPLAKVTNESIFEMMKEEYKFYKNISV